MNNRFHTRVIRCAYGTAVLFMIITSVCYAQLGGSDHRTVGQSDKSDRSDRSDKSDKSDSPTVRQSDGQTVRWSDTTRLVRTALASNDTTGALMYPPPYDGYDPDHTHIQWTNTAIVGGAIGSTVAAIHIYQMNAWWKDQRGPFHFVNDNQYALNVDKAGHFYGGAFASWLARKSLEQCGFSREGSTVWGSVIGACFELYVEVEDGFGRDWGFSPGDAAGDVLGALWPIGQHYIPYMENFQPKFSYFPSKAYRDGFHKGNAFDDYEGQAMWMGVHVWNMLPRAMQSWWPKWLGFAVGVSIRNMPHPGEPSNGKGIERNIYLALDYDVMHILPEGGWWLHALKEGLNFIHFPSPAIKIAPNYVAFGLFY